MPIASSDFSKSHPSKDISNSILYSLDEDLLPTPHASILFTSYQDIPHESTYMYHHNKKTHHIYALMRVGCPLL